ncbi:hypothetical protein ACE41H_21555 [Paenibacillus enshidis]|uniref:Uncharacterized protein n=1 Tax=Paenibacillus enshidis TaxID=1458439 RepID=A0ABV5B135_9BACL
MQSFSFWIKSLWKKNEGFQPSKTFQIPESSEARNRIEISPFTQISDVSGNTPLLKWVKEYMTNVDTPSDIYFSISRDKLNQEVILAVDLYAFKKQTDRSMKLRLFYEMGKVPSFMSIGYKSSENHLIIYDCRAQILRRWHGSIMILQLKELCVTLNQIIDNINKKIIIDCRKKPYIRSLQEIPKHYFKGHIKAIVGEVFPDSTRISYENLMKFYIANDALKDGRVHIYVL